MALDREQKLNFMDCYEQGMSRKEISARFGMSNSAISSLVRRLHLKRPPQQDDLAGQKTQSLTIRLAQSDVEAIKRDYCEPHGLPMSTAIRSILESVLNDDRAAHGEVAQ